MNNNSLFNSFKTIKFSHEEPFTSSALKISILVELNAFECTLVEMKNKAKVEFSLPSAFTHEKRSNYLFSIEFSDLKNMNAASTSGYGFNFVFWRAYDCVLFAISLFFLKQLLFQLQSLTGSCHHTQCQCTCYQVEPESCSAESHSKLKW